MIDLRAQASLPAVKSNEQMAAGKDAALPGRLNKLRSLRHQIVSSRPDNFSAIQQTRNNGAHFAAIELSSFGGISVALSRSAAAAARLRENGRN